MKTEANITGVKVIFICLKGSEHFSFIEGVFSIPEPAELKNQNRRAFWSSITTIAGIIIRMKRVFFEINAISSLFERLTYNQAIKAFKTTAESVSDWKEVNLKCPEESEHYFFNKESPIKPTTSIIEVHKLNQSKFTIKTIKWVRTNPLRKHWLRL